MGNNAGTGATGKEPMFLNAKRILMAEVDAGLGNSAPAATTPAADVPQAQGAAITMTQEQLAATIAAAATKAVADAKDSIFAEARRTFTAPNKTKGKTDDAPAGPAPLTASEERTLLRGLDRAISQSGLKPNSAQYARAERDMLAERPDDVESWTKGYFDGFSAPPAPATVPPAAQAATQAPAPRAPQNAHPASDRGAPPPSQVPLVEADLVTMSDSDRAVLLREKGMPWYRTQLARQLKGRPVTIK